MAVLNCGRCFEPTPATTVERISTGDSRYKIPLCEKHANMMQMEIFGWTRCGILDEDTPVAASPALRERETVEREWVHTVLPPVLPAQPRRNTMRPATPTGRFSRPISRPISRPEPIQPELQLDLTPPPATAPHAAPDAIRALWNPFAAPVIPDSTIESDVGDTAAAAVTAEPVTVRPTPARALPRLSQPLPDGYEEWRFTDHAVMRRRTRRISPAEALWAIAEPDIRQPGNPENPNLRVHIRDHVKVVFDPAEKLIVTVVNRLMEETETNVAS